MQSQITVQDELQLESQPAGLLTATQEIVRAGHVPNADAPTVDTNAGIVICVSFEQPLKA